MKRKLLSVMGVIVGVVGVIFTYANWPMTRLPAGTKADSVLVLKGERKLIMLRDNQRIKEYSITLGGDPIGKKIREGDERTPEGRYKLDYRNQNSIAHLSIRISYPDQKAARPVP